MMMKEKKQKSSGNKFICNECKQECDEKQKIHFANSIMDWTHGFTEYICRECYIKRLEKQLKNIQEGLTREKRLLKKDGNKKQQTK